MTQSRPMMGCGHTANGFKGDQPVCVICVGLRPGSDVIVEGPDLTDRQARCACGYATQSSTGLAFFEYLPDSATGMDSFYCGHAGWD